jgi:hypothetical protein
MTSRSISQFTRYLLPARQTLATSVRWPRPYTIPIRCTARGSHTCMPVSSGITKRRQILGCACWRSAGAAWNLIGGFDKDSSSMAKKPTGRLVLMRPAGTFCGPTNSASTTARRWLSSSPPTAWYTSARAADGAADRRIGSLQLPGHDRLCGTIRSIDLAEPAAYLPRRDQCIL